MMGAQIAFTCGYCGKPGVTQRVTRKWCNDTCAQRHARGWPKRRNCRCCGAEFEVRERSDANRQHCSKQCAKRANYKNIRTWLSERPGYMAEANKRRVAKNPGVWAEKSRADRAASIALLGGVCVVCGASNPNWLHIDYIPTTRGQKYRHPRHFRWIRDNADKLRLLCANHHYELTLTGKIEGTEITQ